MNPLSTQETELIDRFYETFEKAKEPYQPSYLYGGLYRIPPTVIDREKGPLLQTLSFLFHDAFIQQTVGNARATASDQAGGKK